MPYLIDGHNLIPKIPGLDLRTADDEDQLVRLLLEFCRLQGKKAEIYFDNLAPGAARSRTIGRVKVTFAAAGQTADQAIRRHLVSLGRSAPNWTVVSSDQAVQVSARLARARVLPAESFARELAVTLRGESGAGEEASARDMNPDEVKAWLEFFRKPPKPP